MALKSNLFSGDPKLEASAISDPSHILTGATGGHVRKIQTALIKLDRAVIAQNELLRSVYGSSTANAVLAYKRKRNIVNRNYQTQPDNIVGKMTIAKLDEEMFKTESVLSLPPRIEPLFPTPQIVFSEPTFNAPNSNLLFAFKFGENLEPPQIPQIIIPGSVALQMVIPLNGIGSFQVVDGIGETVSCDPFTIGEVFDPSEPAAKGAIFVTQNPHKCNVRGLKEGAAIITVTQSNSLGIPIARFVRVGLVVHNPNSLFVSSTGTPINPKNIPGKRMINIFGERETQPGFENFTTDPQFAQGRPFTNDPNKPPGLLKESASDICLRDSPISKVTLDEMERIAMSGCRLTIALLSGPKDGESGGADSQLKKVRDKFPNAKILQEGRHNEVSDRSGEPTVRKVLVMELP